jgi:hypothetical protein
MEYESDCDIYDGEVDDISVDESGSESSTSEVEIIDSDCHPFC